MTSDRPPTWVGRKKAGVNDNKLHKKHTHRPAYFQLISFLTSVRWLTEGFSYMHSQWLGCIASGNGQRNALHKYPNVKICIINLPYTTCEHPIPTGQNCRKLRVFHGMQEGSRSLFYFHLDRKKIEKMRQQY